MMQTQAEEFLNFVVVEKGYSRHTVTAYRNDLTQFLTSLADEGIASWRDVNRAHILNYVLYLQELGYASSTVARKLAAVKSFFHFLVVDGALEDNPTVGVNFPVVDRQIPRPLSPEEMARLLMEPAKTGTPRALRDRALLELMCATGMRASEIIELDVSAVDLEDGTVRCVGKGNKERIMPLYERVREALSAYLENGRAGLLRGRGETALFISRLGRPLTRQGLWLLIKEYAAAAGINRKVTPQTLRHSFATHMLDRGSGLREVQQLLGHSTIASTQIYTEVSSQQEHKAYDKARPRAQDDG